MAKKSVVRGEESPLELQQGTTAAGQHQGSGRGKEVKFPHS